MSRPLAVVMWVKSASSLLALWGTNTTSEKEVRPPASAASTRSPTLMSEIGLTSPDSRCTVSDPAKHAFDSEEAEILEVGDAVDDAIGDVTGDVTGVVAPLMDVNFEYDWQLYVSGAIQLFKLALTRVESPRHP